VKGISDAGRSEHLAPGQGLVQLRRPLDACRQGDTLVVTKLDRVARSVSRLHPSCAVSTARPGLSMTRHHGGWSCADVLTTRSARVEQLGDSASVADWP